MYEDRRASVWVIGGVLLVLQCTPSGPELPAVQCGSARMNGVEVFVNELAYHAAGNGSPKVLAELVGPAGTNLSGWSLEIRTARGAALQRRWSLPGSLQDQRD